MIDTTSSELTLARFEDLLDRHGSELTRWPDDAGIAARALLSTSSEARTLHAQTAALERRLAGFQAPEPSPELRRRLLAGFDVRHAQRSWLALLWLQLGGARIAMPALAAALALGIAIGNWLPSPVDGDNDIDGGEALALLQYDLGDNGEWLTETPR